MTVYKFPRLALAPARKEHFPPYLRERSDSDTTGTSNN